MSLSFLDRLNPLSFGLLDRALMGSAEREPEPVIRPAIAAQLDGDGSGGIPGRSAAPLTFGACAAFGYPSLIDYAISRGAEYNILLIITI